jgi:hypothetical protein
MGALDRLALLEQRVFQHRVEGTVVLERGEPRPDALVMALEAAGYTRVTEPSSDPEGGEIVGYREPAVPSLSMHFVFRRSDQGKGHRPPKLLHVFRIDERTTGYTLVLLPFQLLQAFGGLVAVATVFEAALDAAGGGPPHHAWVAGLIFAGICFGMPRLWIDDERHAVREAIERAAAERSDAALDAPVPDASSSAPADVASSPHLRVATNDPTLAVAAQTARADVSRHESDEPEEVVTALEHAARRGPRRG